MISDSCSFIFSSVYILAPLRPNITFMLLLSFENLLNIFAVLFYAFHALDLMVFLVDMVIEQRSDRNEIRE